ncbi:MAG: amidase [Proteobacteria bacterium]|nr:amidase [Pseudomonadota bacterium]MCP4916342.1 amidase [Pseudomonadota bacterium]
MLRSSGSALARDIREGRRTSVEVVDAYISEVQQVNPELNAMVAFRFDEARAEAEAADANPSDAPFHGVPCSIKESFALVGMPNTTGLTRRVGVEVDEDAVTVRRYRAAGAIPLGVTNTSEACMWMESTNRVYGRSNNPYDPRRTVGGSSGGEAAIVAAALPFGLGSDVGGSIRMPAFFNGVFGHKPTGGLVPGTGQYPVAHGRMRRMLATGPLTRYAQDLWPLVSLLAGPDGHDDCLELELGDPADVRLSELRVLSIPDNGTTPPSRGLRQAQSRAADHLRSCGAHVEELRLPLLKKSFDIWSAAMDEDNSIPFGVVLGQGEEIAAGRELAKWAIGRSDHTATASLLALTEKAVALVPGYTAKMLALRDELREELLHHLGDDGVFLYPSYTRPAPRHNHPFARLLRLKFDFSYTAILNAMQVPATQVPMGLDHKRRPLGVQVGAAHGLDRRTVAIAIELERAFGGWVPV